MMIYKGDDSGVFKLENNMNKSRDVTIGYMVGKVRKEATFKYTNLPIELMNEYAKVTNKIARCVEENPDLTN